MKSIYTSLLLCLCLFTLSQNLSANHAMAVDLTYACLNEDDQSYTVTLDFYFDCGSVIIQQPAASVFVDVFSPSACSQPISLELTRDTSIPGEEVSQLCESILNNGESNCSSGSFPGVEKYVFEGTVTLPKKCEDWVFSYRLNELEFRSSTITNLVSPELQKIYVQATLDNTQGCNSAPSFASIPVAYYCTQSATFTQGVIETDGDQLDFTLIQPLNNLNEPIPYTNGGTPQNPFLNNSFSFDDETGEIQFETNLAQFPVLAVLVEEYRNGKVIGSVIRDMQFVVLDCDNEGVEATTLPQVPDQQAFFSICAGQNVSLDFEFSDNNAEDVISVVSPNIADFNGANFTQTADAPNPANANFNWTPAIADKGLHVLEIEVSDNRCPISSGLIYTYIIEVVGTPDAGADLSYCNAGGPLQVEIEGGGQFTWSPTTNLTFLNADNSLVEIRPEEAEGTELTYTITNDCGLSDELKVNVVQDILMDFSEDQTICQGDFAAMFALPISGEPSFYTYEWSPANEVENPTAAAVVATPTENSTYSVSVRSNESGCTVNHDFNIDVSPFTGEVNASVEDNELCVGESTQLNSIGVFNAILSCGVETNTQVCSGESTLFELGEQEGSEVTYSPYHGDKKGNRLLVLYKREDLVAMGMQSGYISSVAFNVTNLLSNGNVTYHELSIKMGCTDVELITDFQLGLQEVYFANTYNTQEDWNTHEFFRYYKWDGVSNLLVEICYNDTSVSSGNPFFDQVAYTTVDYACVFRSFSSSGGGCNLGTGPNINNGFKRLDIQFDVCPPQPENPPTITWTPAETLDNPNIANPIATPTETTTYTVVFDDNGCSGSEQVTIEVPNAVDLAIRPDTSICEAQMVQLYLEGNLPNTTTYAWLPIEGLDNPTIANPIATVSETSNYQVTVLLNDICNSEIVLDVNVVVGGLGAASVNPNEIACRGENVDLLASGGTSYQWSPSQNLSCNDCPNPVASPINSGIYQVTISNDSGCSMVLSTNIEVNNLDGATVSEDVEICAERGEAVPLTASGGTTYEWSPIEGLSCSDCPNPEATPSISTDYEVIVTDDSGCSTTLVTRIEVSDGAEITSITPDQSVVRGEQLQLEIEGDFNTIEWSLEDGTVFSDTANPVVTITENITYTVRVENAIGCVSTAMVAIEVVDAPDLNPCLEIAVPNAFSPNEDGINDRFFPAPESFDELLQFTIYNRWGKEVFSTNNPSEGWDGLWDNELQPVGVYPYWVEAICGEKTLRKQGWVVLIR
ncbi:MAG: gliding motility-associated C-terminal domain-containing protein [Chitinophagales bacterium]